MGIFNYVMFKMIKVAEKIIFFTTEYACPPLLSGENNVRSSDPITHSFRTYEAVEDKFSDHVRTDNISLHVTGAHPTLNFP